MNLLAIDIFRTEASGCATTQLTSIKNNGFGDIRISNKTIEHNQTFDTIAREIVSHVLATKPETILLDGNGLGSALQENLIQKLILNNIYWLPNYGVVYK
jgi:hypothetical protein